MLLSCSRAWSSKMPARAAAGRHGAAVAAAAAATPAAPHGCSAGGSGESHLRQRRRLREPASRPCSSSCGSPAAMCRRYEEAQAAMRARLCWQQSASTCPPGQLRLRAVCAGVLVLALQQQRLCGRHSISRPAPVATSAAACTQLAPAAAGALHRSGGGHAHNAARLATQGGSTQHRRYHRKQAGGRAGGLHGCSRTGVPICWPAALVHAHLACSASP